MSDIARRDDSNVVPLGRLQQELAQATAERSLPRLQRVIGAATVAAEAQHKVARLAAGEGSPTEVVKAATDAANDAGAVRLAAEAEAGRVLREMAAEGIRATQGASGHRANVPEGTFTLEDLGVSRPHSRRYQRMADIPDNVRVDYVDETKERGGEVTAAGLLRYAAAPEKEERTADQPEDGLEVAYDDAVRIVGKLLRYDSKALAAHASNTQRRTRYRKLMEKLREWVDQTDPILT